VKEMGFGTEKTAMQCVCLYGWRRRGLVARRSG
jgi:hypothetical protein